MPPSKCIPLAMLRPRPATVDDMMRRYGASFRYVVGVERSRRGDAADDGGGWVERERTVDVDARRAHVFAVQRLDVDALRQQFPSIDTNTCASIVRDATPASALFVIPFTRALDVTSILRTDAGDAKSQLALLAMLCADVDADKTAFGVLMPPVSLATVDAIVRVRVADVDAVERDDRIVMLQEHGKHTSSLGLYAHVRSTKIDSDAHVAVWGLFIRAEVTSMFGDNSVQYI